MAPPVERKIQDGACRKKDPRWRLLLKEGSKMAPAAEGRIQDGGLVEASIVEQPEDPLPAYTRWSLRRRLNKKFFLSYSSNVEKIHDVCKRHF